MFLKLHTLFPVALLIPFLFSGCGAVSDSDSSENLKERLEAHVVFLADDKLEGRESGTQGEKIAREYIQAEFKKTGLSSAGSDLWMQPFEFFAKKTPSAASSFKLGDKALDL
ncbi:MAG: aminopeptidase YwaD, partial [Limisphaerales bacterium]